VANRSCLKSVSLVLCTDSAPSSQFPSDAIQPLTSRSRMAAVVQLLTLLLATLSYPGGVAGDVSDTGLAGAVVGTFVGTLLLCGVLVAAGYWCYLRKRRQNDEQRKPQRHDAETGNNTSSSEYCTQGRSQTSI